MAVVVDDGGYLQVRRRFHALARGRAGKRNVERTTRQSLEEILYRRVLATVGCVAVLQSKQAHRDAAAVHWRRIGGDVIDRVLHARRLTQIAEQHETTTDDDMKHVRQREAVPLRLFQYNAR